MLLRAQTRFADDAVLAGIATRPLATPARCSRPSAGHPGWLPPRDARECIAAVRADRLNAQSQIVGYRILSGDDKVHARATLWSPHEGLIDLSTHWTPASDALNAIPTGIAADGSIVAEVVNRTGSVRLVRE